MRYIKRVFKFLFKTLFLLLVLSIAFVVIYRYVPVYYTPLMGIRSLQQIKAGEKVRLKHKWISYNQISDHAKRAVLASEDQRFFTHKGFDRVEIKKALQENKTRKRPRGASTISQQTAKNVFLWPHSSWIRKGLEAYFTVLIEWIWSKDRILEVYLNSMETGPGIYGVEAVAREHFNTTAKELSAAQSALIAATLPNPLQFDSKNPSAYIKKRQNHILGQMRTVKLP